MTVTTVGTMTGEQTSTETTAELMGAAMVELVGDMGLSTRCEARIELGAVAHVHAITDSLLKFKILLDRKPDRHFSGERRAG